MERKTPRMAPRAGSWLAVILVSMTLPAVAHRLDVELLLGGDSNPRRLSDRLSTRSDSFAEGRLEYSHDAQGVPYYYELRASDSRFAAERNAPDAEESSWSGRAGLAWQEELEDGPTGVVLELTHDYRDTVLIDPESGAPARYGDVEVADRFDYRENGLHVEARVPLSERAQLSAEAQTVARDYESFGLAGLPDLDFRANHVDLGFAKSLGERRRYRVTVGVGEREYGDRAARGRRGALLPGTRAGFRYLRWHNRLSGELSPRWDWQLGVDFAQRQDTEGDYHGRNEAKVFTDFHYANPPYADFRLRLDVFQSRFYQGSNNPILLLEEEEPEGLSYGLRAEWQRSLSAWLSRDVDLLLGLDYRGLRDDDNAWYDYTRGRVWLGLRWRLL